MIVPMRMVTMVCRQQDAGEALAQLRELGVLHLLPHQLRASTELEATQRQTERTQAALAFLPATAGAPVQATRADADAVVDEVHRLLEARRAIEQDQARVEAEREPLLAFGDFDPASARSLADHRLVLRLYLLPGKAPLPVTPAGAALQLIGRSPAGAAVALVGPADCTLAAPETPLPARSLATIERERTAIAERQAQFEQHRQRLTACRALLSQRLQELHERIDLLTAHAGAGETDEFTWLVGACPADDVPRIEVAAADHGWALAVREPTGDDVVPTKLHSPPWARQFHSVLQMLGITPGYAEPDSSALLLVFLVLFAAMLIGDAGYGLLMLGAALWLSRGGRRSQPVLLIRTIGAATIVWGAITGTWFALPTTTLPAVFDSLRIGWLANPGDARTTTQHIMLLCFFVGAVHLTIAHAWAGLRCGRSLQALAQLGWIASTWMMFAIARTMVLGEPFPAFVGVVGAVGILMITLFMTPLPKIKDEWFNHVMLPLSLVSNFVDVVSYLRLFAVGSAGVAVATSFNDMAAAAAARGGFGYAVAALVVAFGHSLNLALCAMGVLVHGVRLNTLEFSTHLGLQWSGVTYKPFARRPSAPAATLPTNLHPIPEE